MASETLLAIDPGKDTGAARFLGDVLVDVKLFTCSGPPVERVRSISYNVAMWCETADRLACEWPQIYQRAKSKGDPNDLLPLAAILGGIFTDFPAAEIVLYKPAEWKGQMSKEACHEKIRKSLGASELKLLDDCLMTIPRSLRHNAMDAVGIGLKALGRFERKRVYAR